MIYDLCININGPTNLLDEYYHALEETTASHKELAPLVRMGTPTILLLNRQLYHEALALLRKRSLVFNHGLLDLLTVNDFMCNGLFRNVASITISDVGHPLFQKNIMQESWFGYMSLIGQVAHALTNETHHLKSLTISLSSEQLVGHVTECWTGSWKCGFRDSLRKALSALRKVRNIPEVKLVGFPAELTKEVTQIMQSPVTNFMDMPREIRDLIYQGCADWSDVTPALARVMESWVDKTKPPTYSALSTPNVLLISKQITTEALAVLHKKPLQLSMPREHDMREQKSVPNMCMLISPNTLRTVRHLRIDVQSWEWVFSLSIFLRAFYTAPDTDIKTPIPDETEARQSSLTSVHFAFHDILRSTILTESDSPYPDDTLHTTLKQLAKIRGLKDVIITGDLPACYTTPLKQIMLSAPNITGDLPQLMAEKHDGSVVSADE